MAEDIVALRERVFAAGDRYSAAMSRKMDSDLECVEAKRAYEDAKAVADKAAHEAAQRPRP